MQSDHAYIKNTNTASRRHATDNTKKAEPVIHRLLPCVLHQLDTMKAEKITTLQVSKLTSLMDVMVICQGNSTRHVKGIADRLAAAVKQQGFAVMGVEGTKECEWVLLDLCDLVVHIMLPEARARYRLEDLWDERLLLSNGTNCVTAYSTRSPE